MTTEQFKDSLRSIMILPEIDYKEINIVLPSDTRNLIGNICIKKTKDVNKIFSLDNVCVITNAYGNIIYTRSVKDGDSRVTKNSIMDLVMLDSDILYKDWFNNEHVKNLVEEDIGKIILKYTVKSIYVDISLDEVLTLNPDDITLNIKIKPNKNTKLSLIVKRNKHKMILLNRDVDNAYYLVRNNRYKTIKEYYEEYKTTHIT